MKGVWSEVDTFDPKCYAVLKDLTYKEFNSLKEIDLKIIKPLIIVRKTNKGFTKSFYNNEYFAHSRYEFFDNDLKHTIYDNNDWKLLNVYEAEDRTRKVYFEIADCKGKKRSVSNLELHIYWTEYFQINGIIKIFDLIKKMSQHPSWFYYDMEKENSLMKKQIQDLELQNECLKGQLNKK